MPREVLTGTFKQMLKVTGGAGWDLKTEDNVTAGADWDLKTEDECHGRC